MCFRTSLHHSVTMLALWVCHLWENLERKSAACRHRWRKRSLFRQRRRSQGKSEQQRQSRTLSTRVAVACPLLTLCSPTGAAEARFLSSALMITCMVPNTFSTSGDVHSSGFILRGAGSTSCSAPPRPRKVAKRPGPHPLGREASGTLLKVEKRPRPRSQPIIPRNTN